MPHERLWAPWRLAYVQGSESTETAPTSAPEWLPGADEQCFLCRDAATPADDRRSLVVARGCRTLVVLNRYPYNNGHLLVAPLEHRARLELLDDATHVEAMRRLGQLTTIFERRMQADGFNVGLNLGRSAGAGVPGHLHWHLVPRWNGDTNFMPVLADVKVIPQALDALWELLTDALSSA